MTPVAPAQQPQQAMLEPDGGVARFILRARLQMARRQLRDPHREVVAFLDQIDETIVEPQVDRFVGVHVWLAELRGEHVPPTDSVDQYPFRQWRSHVFGTPDLRAEQAYAWDDHVIVLEGRKVVGVVRAEELTLKYPYMKQA